MCLTSFQFKCCGNRDFRDYTYQGFVPATCCENASRCSGDTAYKNGCKQTFVRFWDKNSEIIKYTGLLIAAIEVSCFFIVLLNFCLLSKILFGICISITNINKNNEYPFYILRLMLVMTYILVLR